MNLSPKIEDLHVLLINSAILDNFWRLHRINTYIVCIFFGQKKFSLFVTFFHAKKHRNSPRNRFDFPKNILPNTINHSKFANDTFFSLFFLAFLVNFCDAKLKSNKIAPQNRIDFQKNIQQKISIPSKSEHESSFTLTFGDYRHLV